MIIQATNYNTGKNIKLDVVKVQRNKHGGIKFIELENGDILKKRGTCLYDNIDSMYTIPDYELERVEADG